MDSNKLYCRNATTGTTSTSSTTSNGISKSSTSQEYAVCDSNYSAGIAFNCKESFPRSNNSSGKSSQNNLRVSKCNVVYGNTIGNNAVMSIANTASPASSINSGGHCNNSNGSGNYINVMSVPIGTLQYNRRKLTPQEYQCRDDFYSSSSTAVGGNGNGIVGRISTASPSPSIQLQGQSQQQYHHQQQHNHQSQHHHHHPMTQTSSQHHFHHFNQQQQPNSVGCIQQQQHTINTCSPTSAVDPIDDTLSCSLALSNGRMVAATQTYQNSNCDQAVAPTTLAMSSLQSQVPPIMYTVQRVVTTAQIQTAGGNTFTSSSSVSSVVSAVRNETENIGNVLTPVSISSNAGCFVPNDISNCTGNIAADGTINSNVAASQSHLHNSPGLGANANNYVTNQYKGSTSTANGSSVTSTNSSHTSSVKTTSSISRPLQNVIPTCVYLMSRVAVHMEIEGTSQCPSQVMLAAALGCEELGIANKLLAQSIFGLWMTSALLEIQLKSHHRPYVVRVAWPNLLEKFSHGNPIEKKYDEPMIMLKRNVFFSKRDEEKIKDHRILELLYEEAKHNVLSGRYVMESVHSLMLGGIQARIELGPFNSHTHTVSFFRENQSRFLPQHVAKNSSWSWLPLSRKNSAEVCLLEQFKRVPQTSTTRKLMRKYLEFCWALPFYGAAFFHGQVEQPVRGLMSLVNHKDVEVLIAVNERGVFVIDPLECTLLLGLRYEDLSWDFAKPSATDDPECLTCIFLQFDAVENGIQISKLMQVFTKQAPMIDALISHFADNMRKRKLEANAPDQFHDEPNPIQNNGNGVLCNKLSRLTLATFDEEGRCIGQMGSLSISY
ncbi:FERM domain-containing protein 8 Bili isoform 2-T9 [Cochliomyia hominivorax]